VLSCEFGSKKPHTGMFLEAATRLGLPPQTCAYVGNDLYKDIAAAHQAGYALAVLVRAHQANTASPAAAAPHNRVDSLEGLLDLFPARQAATAAVESPAASAALSTLWAIHNFPTLQDFCTAAGRMGFRHIELNHQVNSGHLEGLDLAGYRVSSVHEPCPADISTETLRNEDWLISAVDEEKRLKGMEAVKRSIDLAARLGAPLVVVHAGNVQADVGLERDLKTLVKTGQHFTEEYERLRERFMHQRREVSGPRLEAVKESLVELVDYASRGGVTLGLENRYHYMDIPTPDEMETLLQLAQPGRLGFWLDTGHAHALGVLGLVDEAEWSARFADRIVGIHFHDAIGTRDHNSPGRGEIDFAGLAARLPASAQRTLEIRPDVTAVQLKLGIQYLIEKGCLLIS